MSKKHFYQLVTAGNAAEIYIYGDITACPHEDGVSAASLSQQLANLQGVSQINVYINSYGGDVSEGVAIYNALKRHSARVVTYCDGMACSIASVIFMAGDERIMCDPSFLMIHDAWTCAAGNADDFRKTADDLDVITTASISAYMSHCRLSEQELRAKMKAETWLTHTEAVELGFATGILEAQDSEKPAQNAKKRAFELFLQAVTFKNIDEDDEKGAKRRRKPQDKPDKRDDVPDRSGDSDGEGGDPAPPDAPRRNDDPAPDGETDDGSDGDDEEKDKEEKQKKVPDPAQQWSGFFNALTRLK